MKDNGRLKKILSLFLCLCFVAGAFPVQALATETEAVEEIDIAHDKLSTNSLGEIGGYLSGNVITATNLYTERKFTTPKGWGFAAERGNNLIDKLHGLDASVVGDNNALNGPDRKIINRDGSITWIQDKYHSTAKESVDAAFDTSSKNYRYLDGK